MSLIKDIKTLILKNEQLKFTDIKSGDLILRIADGDKFEVGVAIEQVTEAGVIELKDGEYVTEDNILVVKDNVISEVKDLEVETPKEDATDTEAETFKSISKKLKDVDFVIGVSAWIELPVGVHTIGDMTYTVEEITEDDWTYNAITEIVKVSSEPTAEQLAKIEADKIELAKIEAEKLEKSEIELMKIELEKTKLEFETFKKGTDEVKTKIKTKIDSSDFSKMTYKEKLESLK